MSRRQTQNPQLQSLLTGKKSLNKNIRNPISGAGNKPQKVCYHFRFQTAYKVTLFPVLLKYIHISATFMNEHVIKAMSQVEKLNNINYFFSLVCFWRQCRLPRSRIHYTKYKPQFILIKSLFNTSRILYFVNFPEFS